MDSGLGTSFPAGPPIWWERQIEKHVAPLFRVRGAWGGAQGPWETQALGFRRWKRIYLYFFKLTFHLSRNFLISAPTYHPCSPQTCHGVCASPALACLSPPVSLVGKLGLRTGHSLSPSLLDLLEAHMGLGSASA